MKYPENGDRVSFRLDHKWEGTGRVTVNNPTFPSCPKRFEVELDAPCKEYKVGDKVVVWLEEITACPA